MPDGQVLEFTNVTKRFNEVTAVSDFSARVEPGAVTAFLGPNGAGKTTTLRILLGQIRATSGTATIGGTAYAELRQPLRIIGSVLEETVYRPRRTANRQLTIAAKANGIPLARVGEVLAMVGLEGEGDSRIGGFSLGMRQRLSIANALLGDPGALVFDEPANGLDPEGIRWMRLLMRRLADEGRTVLVSSHLLSEVEQIADNVLVLSKGQLVLASGIETLADPKGGSVVVDAVDRAALTAALSTAGFDVEVLRSGLNVRGGDAGTVGAVAAAAGIALSTLVQRGPTLEDVFIEHVRGGRPTLRAAGAASQPVTVESADAPAAGFAAGAVAAGVVGVAGAAALDDAPETAVAEAEAAEVSAEDSAIEDSVIEDVTVEDIAVADITVADSAAEDSVVEDIAGEDSAADDIAVEDSAVEDSPVENNPIEEGSIEERPVDGEGDEAPESETVDQHDADGTSPDDAPQDDAPQDDAAEDAAPTRSFDEILFGTSTPVASETTESDDAAQADTDQPTDDAHAGVEFFTELGGADETTDSASDATDTENEAASDDENADPAHDAEPGTDAATENENTEAENTEAEHSEPEHDEAQSGTADAEGSAADGDEDPRSAAVSSMLAAAARAYYDDEPKDYPQDESSDEGTHWTVASTGVIDSVPTAGEPAPEGESETAEAETEAAEQDENHDEHAENHGEHAENHEHAEHHENHEHHGDEHHHG
ncbi:ATP-binding cassette domain-containing protein [Microbacterium sp. A8/3-1]|uniref:ATP-binding cassette domain-containing protein n=1 Tax=Microbacterium sp. A8/3-1 TaxID=3160749 RepID=A0AAU7VTN1_9MICO